MFRTVAWTAFVKLWGGVRYGAHPAKQVVEFNCLVCGNSVLVLAALGANPEMDVPLQGRLRILFVSVHHDIRVSAIELPVHFFWNTFYPKNWLPLFVSSIFNPPYFETRYLSKSVKIAQFN